MKYKLRRFMALAIVISASAFAGYHGFKWFLVSVIGFSIGYICHLEDSHYEYRRGGK